MVQTPYSVLNDSPFNAMGAGHFGHKTFRHQDTSAPTLSRITGGAALCLIAKLLSWVQSIPTFRRSDAEVSRTTILAQKCLETVLQCLMRVRSVLVPKCLVAEVSGNQRHKQHTRLTFVNVVIIVIVIIIIVQCLQIDYKHSR